MTPADWMVTALPPRHGIGPRQDPGAHQPMGSGCHPTAPFNDGYPGQATIHVLHGRVRMTAGEQSWQDRTADLLIFPDGPAQAGDVAGLRGPRDRCQASLVPQVRDRPPGRAECRMPPVFRDACNSSASLWRRR
jgi:hypothetical protein